MSRKEKLLYPFYVISHPIDGFYEVRHRGRGSVPVALLLIFLFGLSYSINARYAGFVVNLNNPMTLNAVTENIGTFLIVFLVAVANWSITCLLEGEGRFRDILTVIGYSMLPLVLTLVPLTIISNFIAADEESLYYLVRSIAILYFVILLMIGIMTIHNFSLGKTLVTLVLTFISMVLIIFIVVLLFYLVDQVKEFIHSIYLEVILRV
jgi:hypothetical protein